MVGKGGETDGTFNEANKKGKGGKVKVKRTPEEDARSKNGTSWSATSDKFTAKLLAPLQQVANAKALAIIRTATKDKQNEPE